MESALPLFTDKISCCHDSWPDATAPALHSVIVELRAQNERLQELIAELLIKNQCLRRNFSAGGNDAGEYSIEPLLAVSNRATDTCCSSPSMERRRA
jgi:hypothetical protein